MEQKIFSKRKSKIAGLCGAVLTTTVVAFASGTVIKADETIEQPAAAETASQADKDNREQTTSVQQETTPQQTETSQSSEATVDREEPATSLSDEQIVSQNDANSSSQIDQTMADTNPSDSDHVSKTSAATTEDQEKEVNPVKAQTAAATNNQNTRYSAKDAYGHTNFNKTLTEFGKKANVADVTYDGVRDEFIVVDDPSAPYVPNTNEIAKYLKEYLTELRNINNIAIPVPSVDQVMQKYAQDRANEEADEKNGLDHTTSLSMPANLSWVAEDGHLDMDSSIQSKSQEGYTLASDKATAYYLTLNWFSDYFNIYDDPNDGLKSFGHAVSILSDGGIGMGLGLSSGQDNEKGMWYAQLEFGGNNYEDNTKEFSSLKNGKGEWVLYYKGSPVKFLPNTTFWYVKKSTLPDAASTPNSSDKPSSQSSKDLDPNFKAGNRFQEGKEVSVHQAVPVTFKSHRDEVGNKDQDSLATQLPNTGVQKNNQLALIALGTGLALLSGLLLAKGKSLK
ncbi:putative cross-wall-targeting lipoprotein signal domain-containing protein [Streptococcus troglodytae]|uniref:Cell wall protein, WapE n=1 Tax=Streptococcus troglodytae TaxID=1111760 RepID=A0A1L7LJ38_9STRE|nr:putative cross-wall-targeting lipoprotein signal domain-containing proteiin [Streptococcus troglodytae]BAQ24207.1 cell wall protein, WapE [Streptococcus troglodytae]